MKKGAAHIILLFLIFVVPLAVAATYYFVKGNSSKEVEASPWAFEETFEGCVPTGPSSCPLPTGKFEFISTHRVHPSDPAKLEQNYSGLGEGQYPAQHTDTCGPPPGTHVVQAKQDNDTQNPEPSFFMCGGAGNAHLMSSAAHVSGYSVTNFWPRQEFDFSDGNGIVEFDNSFSQVDGGRVWYEILIAPKEELQIAAARESLPVDETYPKNRLLFSTHFGGERHMEAGKGAIQPAGVVGSAQEGRWSTEHPGDPALTDARIRRKNIIEIEGNKVRWKVQQADGNFDTLEMTLSEPLSFSKGLVFFKTHSYTPDKANNFDKMTFHWDNIRFDGPKLTPYESYFARVGLPNPVRGVGQTITQTVNLPRLGTNPAIAGQFSFATDNNISLSVNGNTPSLVNLHTPEASCEHRNIGSFRQGINPAHLKTGENTLKWTVVSGSCSPSWTFSNHLSPKAVHIQMDAEGGTGGITPTSAPSPSSTVQPVVASPTPSPSPTPTLAPSPKASPSPTVAPSPIVGGSSGVIDFNSLGGGDQAFSGQYPSGVIDWGSGKWVSGAAWRKMTTPNLSFIKSTSTITSTFSFLTPSTVTRLDVFNGGTVASTLTLACSGNTNVSIAVAADEFKTVSTGWTKACTTVSATSTNGWSTVMDNLNYVVGSVASTPSPTPTPTPQNFNKFVGQYFNTVDFNRLRATRDDANINFDWGTGRPQADVHEETFSVRWIGDFGFFTGNYRFNVTTDDGMRIWIDNVLVFDKWVNQAPTNYSFTRNMVAGFHNIKVEYFDNTGRAVAKLNWQRL